MPSCDTPTRSGEPPRTGARRAVVAAIVGAAVLVGVVGGVLVWHASRQVNRSALAAAPRPVAFVEAKHGEYRASRTYIGTIAPWLEANIGPQYISAYVLTVRVRPGDAVERGAIVATLDCSNPRAVRRAAEMAAQSIESRRRAIADEATRVHDLASQGYAAINESEKELAQSESERSQELEANAHVTAAKLGVQDCVLAAPFEGEIATRDVDPGAFVRPGSPIVSIVDRTTDRIVIDVPEKDFNVVRNGTEVAVDVLSTGARLTARVSRRAPKADPATRTVHVEVDVPDPERAIPVGTTAMLHVDVGRPLAASELPAYTATVREDKASVFVIDGDVVRRRELTVIGEIGGTLFVDPQQLPAGTRVVSEGRALLSDGDRVAATPDTPAPARGAPAAARGAGHGRPL